MCIRIYIYMFYDAYNILQHLTTIVVMGEHRPTHITVRPHIGCVWMDG